MNFASPLLSLRRVASLLAIAILALAPNADAQTQDDVTVAFLYNFARFVEWPGSSFEAPNAPFVVGFLQRPALAQKFESAVQGKNAGGRDFVVKKLQSVSEAAGCQIVFCGDASEAAAVIAAVKGKPVLTVGDGDGFIGAGGMIAFSREGARLVFDVNPTAISAATMKPAEKITKAARAIKSG